MGSRSIPYTLSATIFHAHWLSGREYYQLLLCIYFYLLQCVWGEGESSESHLCRVCLPPLSTPAESPRNVLCQSQVCTTSLSSSLSLLASFKGLGERGLSLSLLSLPLFLRLSLFHSVALSYYTCTHTSSINDLNWSTLCNWIGP